MISPTGVFLVAFLGFFSAVRCDMKCPGIAEYKLSFYGMWSEMTHPNAVPVPQGKFSPWVGASHNMYYKMWDEGMLASEGVQQVAESGKFCLASHFLHCKLLQIANSTSLSKAVKRKRTMHSPYLNATIYAQIKTASFPLSCFTHLLFGCAAFSRALQQ